MNGQRDGGYEMKSVTASGELKSLARQLEAQGPAAVLRWGIAAFRSDLVIATSFGPEGIVNLHLASRIDPGVHVFYIETGLLFQETYALRDLLQAQLGLTFEAVKPPLNREQQAAQYGENLWQCDPDSCCFLRKVAPLRRYLADKRAWVTGIRRDQTPVRASAQVVEWDEVNRLIKINPLAAWSADQVWAYIEKHHLPVNPLHDQGYASIGCWPCTRPVLPGEDDRAGRWHGFVKTECGLHQRNGRGALSRPSMVGAVCRENLSG
jgi:phosphoadenosine phosphosulfate reductase